MSWIYVPESAASPSHSNTLSGGSKPCATSNGTNTASKSSNKESPTATLTTLLYGGTCENSTGNPGVDAWILSLRASRASRSALPVSSGGKQTNETSGRICGERFAKYDRKSCSWRTYQLSLLTNTESEYSGTWPKAGMIVAGVSYRLPKWEHRIREIGCGYLRTPLTPDGLWRTPSTTESEGGIMEYRQGANARYKLRDQVVWPTPQARDTRNTSIKHDRLPDAVNSNKVGGQLNPTWVGWLMGYPNEWTDLKHLGTQSFQQWLQKHGRY